MSFALSGWLIFFGATFAREVASSKPREGQRSVNAAVNARMTTIRDAAILDSWTRSPGDSEKALVAVWKAFTFPLTNRSIASIELALENDRDVAPGLNFGDLGIKERVRHPVFAPSLLLTIRGKNLSVGADKFGHFFEEGFFVRQIAQEGGSAEDISRWLEGLETDAASRAWIYENRKFKAWWVDEEGKREYDLVDCWAAHAAGKSAGVEYGSSPADVAANLAGMKWFDGMKKLLDRAPKDREGLEKLLRDNPFRVEDVVTEAWDESVNPNVKTLEKRPDRK